jgi:hypothetical protein
VGEPLGGGGLKKKRKEEARLQERKEGKYHNLLNTYYILIPRTTPRDFFGILTTPRREKISALEGLLRPEVFASIWPPGTGTHTGDAGRRTPGDDKLANIEHKRPCAGLQVHTSTPKTPSRMHFGRKTAKSLFVVDSNSTSFSSFLSSQFLPRSSLRGPWKKNTALLFTTTEGG